MDVLGLLDTAAGRVIAWGSALGILAALLRWGWRLTRKIGRMADQFLGDPERGIPSLPQRTAAIEQELKPNHGASLRDAVDGVRAEVGAVRQELAEHKAEHNRNPVTVNVGQVPTTPST